MVDDNAAGEPLNDAQPAQAWTHALATSVGAQVKAFRTQQGLSAQALADFTEQLGHGIKRSVIAEMENGKRTTVSLADVLVLARALYVPPLVLVYPLGAGPVEMVPGEKVAAVDAIQWASGERMTEQVPRMQMPLERDVAGRKLWRTVSTPLTLTREQQRLRLSANGHQLWADVYDRQAEKAGSARERERLASMSMRETELAAAAEHEIEKVTRELLEVTDAAAAVAAGVQEPS